MSQEIEKYFNDCLNIFNHQRDSENHTIFYDIGSRIFKINYISRDLLNYFDKAINHLRVPFAEKTDINIYVMDKITINKKLPKPVWDWSDMNTKGDIDIGKPRFYINYEGWGILRIYDSILNKALFWVEDIYEIPYWHRSFPFRTIINWYFYSYDFQPVHAAAVGNQNGCVILVGKGGSGKSCTALSCLNSDLNYMGDDFVLVKINNLHPEVYSLYNVAKLEQNDMNRFPYLRDYDDFPDHAVNEKLQIFINQIYPEKILLNAPLRAVMVPKIVNKRETTILPVSKETALKALVPSTINLLRGEEIRPFKKMSDLIRKVPCYLIEIGDNHHLIPGEIQKHLNKLSEE
jgi:hypothetical protein